MNLKITKSALDKAEDYARIASKLYKSECYGWLLTPRGSNDFVVRDVSFAHSQQANYTHVGVGGDGVILSANEALQKGYRMMGWWHSHVDFEPFQSSTDQRNTLDVLNVLALTNYCDATRERKIMEGELETIVTKEGMLVRDKEKRSLLLQINGNFLLDRGTVISGVKLFETRRVGFCYSLTVNAKKGKPSVQLALQFDKGNDVETKLVDTEIEIIDSYEELEEEIRKKLGR